MTSSCYIIIAMNSSARVSVDVVINQHKESQLSTSGIAATIVVHALIGLQTTGDGIMADFTRIW